MPEDNDSDDGFEGYIDEEEILVMMGVTEMMVEIMMVTI